jgi:hypothetical protein
LLGNAKLPRSYHTGRALAAAIRQRRRRGVIRIINGIKLWLISKRYQSTFGALPVKVS